MTEKIFAMLMHVLARLPLGVSRGIGSGLAQLAILMKTRGYLVTERNLTFAYPDMSEESRKKLARESLKQSAQMGLETPAVWFRKEEWRASKTLSVSEQSLFDQGRADGRGVLILLPHFGNWEMAGLHISSQMTATAMYAPPKFKPLNPLMKLGRSTAEMVPASTRGVMKVLKALNRGEMTLILPDQVPNLEEAGVYAPFFNRPAFTMTLIYKLISKTKPTILIGYAIRRKGGFDVGYMSPDQDIYSDDEQTSVAALNRSLEELVKKAPEQYQWEYKRFKKQPTGEVGAYQGLS